jgi:hypothetical protein
VTAVGCDVHRVVESRIRQPLVTFAIKPDAVKLKLHVIVAVTSHVVEQPGVLVDFDNRADFKIVISQCGEQLAAEIVEVEVLPSGAF